MIETRPTDLSSRGLEEVRHLLHTCFPNVNTFDGSYLDWCYNRHPISPAIAFNTYSGDRLIGHVASLPIMAFMDGVQEKGLLGVNGATYPTSRSKGIYLRTLEGIFEAGAKNGYGFWLGVANEKAASTLSRHQNIQIVGSLEAKLGVGPIPAPSPHSNAQLVPIWETETVLWRLGRPGAKYAMRSIGDHIVLYAKTSRFGIVAEIGRIQKGSLSRPLPRLSAITPLKMWLGLDSSRCWSRSAYINLPIRFRPSPLVLAFVDISGKGRTLSPNRIIFQGIDFDAF